MFKEQVLKRHMKNKMYDRNGTGEPRPVIKRVFVPSDRSGRPLLILLCSYSDKDRYGRFEYCIFTDMCYGGKHVPSDSFGFGTKKQALATLKEHVFESMTDIWPWVINEAWKKTHALIK